MKINYVSASQISDFAPRHGGCPRLWALKKLARIEQAGAANLDFGTAVHAVLEKWLMDGVTPLWYEVRPVVEAALQMPCTDAFLLEVCIRATTALKHLQRHPQTLVEHYIQFPMWDGGPTMVGYIDQLEPPTFGPQGVVVGVEDHKTSSNSRYHKTPDELAKNIQLITYAYWVFRFPHLQTLLPVPPSPQYDLWLRLYEDGADYVKLAHTYIATKGDPSARRVEKLVDWPMVAKEWALIEQDVRDMVALAASLPEGFDTLPNDAVRQETITNWLLQNVDGEPGRCHKYRGCQFKGMCPEAITGTKGADNLEMAKVFAAIKGDESMSDIKESDLAARLRARMGAAQPVAPAAPPAPEPTQTATSLAMGVVAPDAPTRTTEVGQEPSPDRHAEEEATAAAPVKKTRAKRTSSPATAPEAATAPNTPPPTEEAPGAPAEEPRVGFKPAGAIFVNCRPYGAFRPYDGLAWEKWVAEQLEGLHAELKVLDYKLVEFGKGPGALSAWLRKNLSSAPEVCIVNSMHPEAQQFLAIALPHAQLVVK
jgi:hypothetical protein